MVLCLYKALFENIVLTVENGGQRPQLTTSLGYTREQADAIQKLKHAKDDYQRLGLPYSATRYWYIISYTHVTHGGVVLWLAALA